MAKRPNHRPRRNTPEQVAEAVQDMIREYQETGDVGKLTDYALLVKLGNIAPRTLERYYDGTADKALLADMEDDSGEDINGKNRDGEEYTKATYGEAVKGLIEFRRSEAVRHIASGGAATSITGWIFLSKQPHWGGFQDVQREVRTGVQEFKVTISGPDGKALKE